jgi:histidinol phosphatase-like enzyme (inositol monophosphatase family)
MAANDALAQRLEFARQIAREAGQLTLRYFQQGDLAVDMKADATPVTEADRQAEQLLRRRIAERFAGDAVLGEEFGESAGTSGFRWILDPIDGTKSFVRGVPLYGTLVGVEHDGQPAIGVIEMPALAECAWAGIGLGAWHQRAGRPPERASVSQTARLAQGLVCSSDVAAFGPLGRQAAFERLVATSGLYRTWGDCYGYLLVATGRAEAMVDPAMSVWDAAALLPVLQEAGGTFTDWRGAATIHGGEGIATNGRVLAEVLAAVKAL